MDARYLAAIKRFEGFASRTILDYGQYSVGFGTKARFPGEVIDVKEAEARFEAEIAKAEAAVEKFAPYADEGMKAALTSLTYNAGTAWMKSGLGSAVACDDTQAIGHLFAQYNTAGGAALQGLVNRRLEELSWMAPEENAIAKLRETPLARDHSKLTGGAPSLDMIERAPLLWDGPPTVARDVLPGAEGRDISRVLHAAADLKLICNEYWRLVGASMDENRPIRFSGRDRAA